MGKMKVGNIMVTDIYNTLYGREVLPEGIPIFYAF